MAVAVDQSKRGQSVAVGGEGSKAAVPPLLGAGLRATAVERDGGAEAEGDFGSDFGAPEPLPVSPPGGSSGVRDQLPEGVDRWHRYGGVTFCGVPVAQYWAEFILWESLLNERTYDTVVELGTLDGGFSLYLASQAHHRGIGFRTYDIRKPPQPVPGFVQIDIFARADEIGEHLRRHDPVIVFCDGGNKPRELRTFSRYVTASATLVVHDWMTEMFPRDVPDNVEMIHESWCKDLGSASRVFRVRDD